MNQNKQLITFFYTLLILLSIPTSSYSQTKAPKSKKINIGLSIPSTQKTYFNIGFLSNVHQVKGMSINVITSNTRTTTNGLQIAGIANTTVSKMNGVQVSGIANVNAFNANGIMLSGLTNITRNTFNGIQLGGLGNITGKSSRGLAIGGLLNIVGKESNGVRFSGLTNLTGDNLNGVDVSGFMNVAGDTVKGIQLTGILNVSGGKTTGMQIAGLGNVSVETSGLQIAALSNLSIQEMRGIQVSAVNLAGKLRGVQLGIVNATKGEQQGVQIGVVNYSKDTTTHKIGLVNLNPKTKIQMLAFGGNTSKINVGVRFKNRHTYTILGIGTHYLDFDDKFSGSVTYRAGLYHALSPKWEISGDLGYAHIETFSNKSIEIPKRMFSLQGRINVNYQIQKRLGLFTSAGYAWTRSYNRDYVYERKPIIELGVILF